jgi:MFS family permease
LDPEQWGLVTGGFAIAYALFEIPSGHLADRFGARAMLLRIVLWWSAFTAATGLVHKVWELVVVRFLFGAGEAGAYPTAATVIYRWFPPVERGRAFGVVLLAAQLGGAIAPLLIVPVQAHFGWRTSFFAFGAVGACWSVAWWRWYRNTPGQVAALGTRELLNIGSQREESGAHSLPWRALASNRSVLTVMGTTFGYLYAYYFFLFWMPTFLMREHGFTENQTQLSALPFFLGIVANLSGGLARDAATRRWGRTWGPRSVGLIGLGTAATAALAALASHSGYGSLVWLAVCYGGITFQQPAIFSTCVDIGGRYSGAVAGCMNTAGAVGGLVSSGVFGFLIQHFGGYDAVLISMSAALALGAALWLVTDATEFLA